MKIHKKKIIKTKEYDLNNHEIKEYKTNYKYKNPMTNLNQINDIETEFIQFNTKLKPLLSYPSNIFYKSSPKKYII